MRKNIENVMDMSAFYRSLTTSSKPLSVNVMFLPKIHKDISGCPGSLHISRMTRERTNITGSRYHWNSFFNGDPDASRPIQLYTELSRAECFATMVTKRTTDTRANNFVQGLILENRV